jgi:hypothetical protein
MARNWIFSTRETTRIKPMMPNQKDVADQDLLKRLVAGLCNPALHERMVIASTKSTNDKARKVSMEVLPYVALPGFG